MPLFDLPLAELETYDPDVEVPEDFDAFWKETLAQTRHHDLDPRLVPYDLELPLVDCQDLTFGGFAGDRVHAWFLRPRGIDGPLPCVVRFLGYGDGRGAPIEWLPLVTAGNAVIVMDTRGQGARDRRSGSTGDPHGSDAPHSEGFLTRGILDPADYHYRRVFTDAVRAVETAHALEGIDTTRVAVSGTSQGGGIAIAASALAEGVAATVTNVPFLCHYRRAVDITDKAPYAELLGFVRGRRHDVETAFRTLSYFDGANLATRATNRASFSVGLHDAVCPPSTVDAAYNRWAGDKEMTVYPFNEHEGGGVAQDESEIRWLREVFA